MNPAITMVDEGNELEKQGRFNEAMERYEAAARSDPRCARAHLNRGNILLSGAQFDEARNAYQLAVTCEPHYAAAHFNLGNLNYKTGAFKLALRNYEDAVRFRPDFTDALVAMANTFDNLGCPAEAVESYQRALAIHPDYAEVHFNLGILAANQGRHGDAVKSLLRAVEIKSDFTQARHALVTELSKLEDLNLAEAGYRRVLDLDPQSDEIIYPLAMILLTRGKVSDALQLLLPPVESSPTLAIKVAFASCISRARFVVDDARIRTALTTAIVEPWGLPSLLFRSALSLIMLDRRIADCIRLTNASWPARLPRSVVFGGDGLAALASDSLLHALLEATTVSTIEFERFLTSARLGLLEIASSDRDPNPSELAALRFFAALSQQCFINEYIFDCDDNEKVLAEACLTKLLAMLDANVAAPPLLLLAVAAYFPLYTLREAKRLLDSSYSAPVNAVLRQQICEPLEEQALREGIERLTPITAGVSEEVRDQYEQNPYPRWVKLPKHEHSPQFNEVLRGALPFGPFIPMPDGSTPKALIAGCGTGSHPILTAQRFRGIRVLAIDLSRSSISYAKRKTRELAIANIEYAQADILKLSNLSVSFDIIESVGVLHHLADPFDGLRILVSLLRPGGFMFLGLYSELARRHVVNARAIIAARGYSSGVDDIRRFRRDLAQNSVELQILGQYPDFFSTSDCRDLLFHVQEHRLTLGQIEIFLAELNLDFIGFELDRSVLHQYRARYSDDPSCTQLRNWASFEADNPDTFVGMYRFWIQKPSSPTQI